MYKTVLFTKESSALYEPPAQRIDPGHTKLALDSPHEDLQAYIRTIKPTKGQTWVLVNAMGAGEYYGDNINGDYFPYKELVTHTDEWLNIPVNNREQRLAVARDEIKFGYPTFYNAHAFKHHVNKNPERAFGFVECVVWNEHMKRVELIIRLDHAKCEKFNAHDVVRRIENGDFPDVSMGCFKHKSAKILTKDLTEVPIGEIREGDAVLTHKGRCGTVTETFSSLTKGLRTTYTRTGGKTR